MVVMPDISRAAHKLKIGRDVRLRNHERLHNLETLFSFLTGERAPGWKSIRMTNLNAGLSETPTERNRSSAARSRARRVNYILWLEGQLRGGDHHQVPEEIFVDNRYINHTCVHGTYLIET